MALLDQLDVFFGELNPCFARVGARLPRLSDDLRLAGVVYGPRSPISHTLPARIALGAVDLPGWVCATATVPDPCYWSPDHPISYDVRVDLIAAGGQVIERAERCLGLRHLGCDAGVIKLETRPWTLRGVSPALVPATEFDAWREQQVVPVVEQLEPWLARVAESTGAIVAVRPIGGDCESKLRAAARCPAVAIALVAAEDWNSSGVRNAAGNLLVGGLPPARGAIGMPLDLELASEPLATARSDPAQGHARVVIDFLQDPFDSLPAAVRYGRDLMERRPGAAGFVLLPDSTTEYAGISEPLR